MDYFLATHGKIYIADMEVAPLEVPEDCNLLGEFQGSICIDWYFTPETHGSELILGEIEIEGCGWTPSKITELIPGIQSGDNGEDTFHSFTKDMAQKSTQWAFRFRRSDNDKLVQIRIAKVKLSKARINLAKEDFVSHSLVWKILAPSDEVMMEVVAE